MGLFAAHLTLSALVVVWNVVVAGRIAKLRGTTRDLAAVSALSAIAFAPALFIAIASASSLTGRSLYVIAWVWPAAAAIIALQSILSVGHRRIALAIGLPIAAYDIILAVVYGARYAIFRGAEPGLPFLSLVAADLNALAAGATSFAIATPYFLHLPIISPGTAGRKGAGTLLRGTVALLAAAWLTMILGALPSGRRAVLSYRRYAGERLQERPKGDLAIGLRVFSTLGGPASPLALRQDLALADSMEVGALSVYLTPAGAGAFSLESLARALDLERTGRRVIVALRLEENELFRRGAESERVANARLAEVERIARRLRPDYIVPVVQALGPPRRQPPESGALEGFLTEAARAARRGNPAVRVMAHVGGTSSRDSAMFAWAASPGSPLQGVAVSVYPWYEGADALDARTAAIDRWLRATPPAREIWVLETLAFPLAHGEASQELALHGALAWATARPAITGFIVRDAADYGEPIGLRAPGGRMRPAAEAMKRAIRAIRETGQEAPTLSPSILTR